MNSVSALHSVARLACDAEEYAVTFRVDDQTLVGNLVVPEKSCRQSIGVVFVHGWSGVRGGPHGLLTYLARTLANDGFSSFRFDLRGRGESEGDGLTVNLPSMAADLVGAVSCFQERTNVAAVVLAGMCSGGNVAIGTIPQLPRLAGLFLLSVYPFSDGDSFGRDMNRTWHHLRTYWHKLWMPETWRKLRRGNVNFRQVYNVLFGHFRKKKVTADGSGTSYPSGADETADVKDKEQTGPPQKHLEKLRVGVPVRMVYGTADPDAKTARAYYEAFANRHSLPVDFVEINGANHNFSSMAWKQQLSELAVAFCRETSVSDPGAANA